MVETPNAGLVILRRCLFLVSVPLFFVTFALPVQSKALGASAVEIGGLFSLFTFSILLMRPVIGFGIDYFGRRIFFLFAMVFYIGAYTGYAVADGLQTMYIARFFQGLGAALMLISVDTMTSDLVPASDRGQAMGANVEIQARSSVVGATIGFGLVAAIPALAWTSSFGLFAVLATLALLLALVQLPETRPASSTRAATIKGAGFKPTPALKRLFLIFVFLGISNALIMPIYLIYLQDNFTSDPRMLSWAFLPAALVFMFLPSKLGAFADKRNPVVLMVTGMLIAGCLYLTMPLAKGFWSLVLIYSISVIGWSLIEPTRKSLTAGAAPPGATARTFGFAEMAFGVGATIGPLIGGYLYDNVSQTSPFIFNSLLILGTALLSGWLLSGSIIHSTVKPGKEIEE
ncbi:MAG: MFS transporter [bacterium]|nr:MFS transporter [Gammaproteobacteria bacterium]HIL97693.1 MFS transporter [Pseudomonadales bacterium]